MRTIFKEMAGRIEIQMEELKASDKMRRELVANVSHDLRTPLATLQGYIETLLIKENQYSQKERRQYLEIAQQELAHIFKRFYSSGPDRKGKNSHSGLGLAITGKIMELHQRSIRVSTDPGKGSSFSFSLAKTAHS